MTSPSALLRERLIDAVREPITEPALLLSGGADSGLLLTALLAAGHRPALFTIQFGEHDTVDTIAAAKRWAGLCPTLRLTIIRVPRHATAVHQTVEWTIEEAQSVLKSTIEPMILLKPAIEQIQLAGAKTIFAATAGSMLWGLGLTAALIKKKEGDAAWTNVRMRWAGHEMHGFPPSATRLAKWYAGRLGLAWRDPLYEIAGTFERFTADEMHERQNKSLAVKAFPELGSTPLHSGEFADGIGNFVTHVLAPEHGCDLQRDYYRHVASQMAIPSRGSQYGRDVWSRR